MIILMILIFLAIIAWICPKRLTKYEVYTTNLFALFFGKTVDEFLDIKYNIYGFFYKGVDYLGVIAQLVTYPTINILFLNYYPLHKGRVAKVFYVLGWSLFSIIFETIAIHTSFFYYNGWKTIYSAVLYPPIFGVLLLNLKYVKWIKK